MAFVWFVAIQIVNKIFHVLRIFASHLHMFSQSDEESVDEEIVLIHYFGITLYLVATGHEPKAQDHNY